MKKIVEGVNDLFTTNPELKDRWDFNKNVIKPNEVSAGSNRKVFWICEHGHSFDTEVYRVAKSTIGFSCPVCKNHRIIIGVNDLATTNPELLAEWDFEKNTIKPREVHAGSHIKAWWKCKAHGHSWVAEIYTRAKVGLGCPICSNQKVLKGYNDLATLYPEIKKYWDYEKNEITPEEIPGIQSNKRAWFKCEEGHSWKTGIKDFTRGTRCPVCCNKVIITGVNDLFTKYPNLEKEWDFSKNTRDPYKTSAGSKEKAWWKCEKGHSWYAVINTRTRGNGCPECAKETQSSLPEKAIYYYVRQIFKDARENELLKELKGRELDIYIPSYKIAIEYDGVNWHKNIKRDLEKDSLCKQAGIKLIRIRERGCLDYNSESIKIVCPRVHSNILLLEETLNNLFCILEDLTHIKASIVIDLKNDSSKINELFVTYQKENSLAKLSPDIASEWNYQKNGNLTPEMFSNSSNVKVWWKCKLGHEWQAIIGSRTGVHHHNGCPICSGHKVLPGFNDLASQYPNIAREWDYKKNGDLKPDQITALNNKKAWWLCSKGHSYESVVRSRTKMGSGCPVCSGLKPEKGVNDFETLYPDLAKEWDYKKNGDLKPSDFLPGSEKVVWWICPKGHSYDTQIAIRAKYKCKCPVCNNKRVVPGLNDLETLHPELAKEWNYEKNGSLLPKDVGGGGGSHKKVWWICEHNHEWEATLASRIRLHTGCPTCAIERNKKRK